MKVLFNLFKLLSCINVRRLGGGIEIEINGTTLFFTQDGDMVIHTRHLINNYTYNFNNCSSEFIMETLHPKAKVKVKCLMR